LNRLRKLKNIESEQKELLLKPKQTENIHRFLALASRAHTIDPCEFGKRSHNTCSKKPTKMIKKPDRYGTSMGCLGMYSGSDLVMNKTARSNTVTCAIISDCASIFEFMQHYQDSDAYEVRLSITKVLSLTHAATSLISWVWDRLRDHDHPQRHEYDHRTQGPLLPFAEQFVWFSPFDAISLVLLRGYARRLLGFGGR
jgi:hypothetical protein